MNDQSNKDLDSFLGDLRRSLRAQEDYLLNCLFKLQFPEVEGGLDPSFDPQAATGLLAWLEKTYMAALDEPVFFRRLLVHQQGLVEQVDALQEKAKAKQLDSASYAHFLRSIQRFNELADQLRNQVTSSLIELDELTGLLNRKVMERDLEEEWAHVGRTRQSFSVAMLDLDHFKKVNDNLGHAFGDLILQQLAAVIEDQIRPYDRVYRYGGEEFLVLLQDTPAKAAQLAMERLRQVVENHEFGNAEQQLAVTLSIGVASSDQMAALEELIKAADTALYSAKDRGRNQVVVKDKA